MEAKSIQQLFLNQYKDIHAAFTRYCSTKAFGILATEDLVQESVLQTLKSFHNIRYTDQLLGYMIGVANNIVKNQRRRLKFQGEWDEKQLEYLTSKLGDPELALDIQYLNQCIATLPQNQQEVLILHEISGCSIKEIAHLQDVSEEAVKTRLHRSRKKVKALYEKVPARNSFANSLMTFISILI